MLCKDHTDSHLRKRELTARRRRSGWRTALGAPQAWEPREARRLTAAPEARDGAASAVWQKLSLAALILLCSMKKAV